MDKRDKGMKFKVTKEEVIKAFHKEHLRQIRICRDDCSECPNTITLEGEPVEEKKECLHSYDPTGRCHNCFEPKSHPQPIEEIESVVVRKTDTSITTREPSNDELANKLNELIRAHNKKQ